jgi:hypothetical protein
VILAASTRPHRSAGSAAMTPAPRAAPRLFSVALSSVTEAACAIGSQAPWKPPIKSAWAAGWLASRVRSGAPISTSMTWDVPSAWCTVVSMLPGSCSVPSSRNHRGP